MIIQHTFTQRNRAAKRAPEMGGGCWIKEKRIVKKEKRKVTKTVGSSQNRGLGTRCKL